MTVKIETHNRLDPNLEEMIRLRKLNIDDDAFHNVFLGENRKCIMLEPVNGDPYIYVQGGEVLVWSGEKGNGTDRLRARIRCQIFFGKINASAPAFEVGEYVPWSVRCALMWGSRGLMKPDAIQVGRITTAEEVFSGKMSIFNRG